MGLFRLLIICALSLSAQAATSSIVLQVSTSGSLIAVSHPSDVHYRQRDFLCLYADQEEVACGRVIYTNRRGALVKLDYRNSEPDLGQNVDYARHPESVEDYRDSFLNDEEMDDYIAFHRALASNPREGALSVNWNPPKEKHDLRSALYFALNVQNPELGVEFSLQGHATITLALGANFFSSSGVFLPRTLDGTVYGAMLASNYYSRSLFEGWWMQAGVGVYNGDLIYSGFSETKNLFTIRALTGWRWLSTDYNWGVGFGLQYFSSDESLKIPKDIELIVPLVQLHFGWVF